VNAIPEQKEGVYHGSLLDPRTHGWVLEQSWRGLFNLYTRDGEARAEFSPELVAIEAAQLQGYSAEDQSVANVKGALILSAILHQAMEDGNYDSPGFHDIRRMVADRFVSEFGGIILELMKAKRSDQAAQAAIATADLMGRAASAIVRTKFPRRSRGARSYPPKGVLAIRHARELCEHFRRLPTKREVRLALESAGIGYVRSKDPAGKWAKLFVSAGLASLPE
jgi:hypothetical protein